MVANIFARDKEGKTMNDDGECRTEGCDNFGIYEWEGEKYCRQCYSKIIDKVIKAKEEDMENGST